MSAKPVFFLVVDDSRLHHQMYMLVFAKGALAGSTLLHAKNGREGYALCSAFIPRSRWSSSTSICRR